VLIPLVVGIALLGSFIEWEGRTREPMMPLHLFASRNFTVGNLTTLVLYGGLGVATFLLVVFLQQVAGYRPIEAGLSLLPITVVVFLLSRRFGALADRLGPRGFMAGGPLLAGAGLLLLVRVGAHAQYAATVLPGILVFGVGLAATVAPLTATVLGAVEQGHSGVASGVNNAVARVASLLAIAAIGAVVAGSFGRRLDHDLASAALSAPAQAAVARDHAQPLVISVAGVPRSERPVVHGALVNASVHAFRVGLLIAGGLAVLGGLVALVGIENPRRRIRCADCPGGAIAGASLEVAHAVRAPAAAASS
jgi:predicted MFS family arabinose efflux permease